MAFKTPTVLDGNTESALYGISGVAVGTSDETELPSVSALLVDSILPPGGEFSLRRAGIDLVDSDNYQVALVHLGKTGERVGTNAQRCVAMKRVLVLPLTWRALMVRVRAALRDSGRASREVRFGQIRADLSSMEVSRAEQSVTLTAMEFKALAFLVDNPGRVISRTELLDQVWGYDNYPSTRTVDNHIMRLRQKLERDPSRPVHFLTVHRVGYKFVP